MTIDTEKTVGEIAVAMPEATRVFEQFGIDYCCGGGQSLAEACASRGADIDAVLRSIRDGATMRKADTDYGRLNQEELVEHIIETHHAFTRREMQRILALVEKVVSVHGQRHPELLSLQKTFRDLADDLMPHMFKEENVLFPYIVRIEAAHQTGAMSPVPPFGTVQNPVRMMMFEHDLAGELLRAIRRVTSNYTAPDDACVSYRTLYSALQEFEQDLHQHIHLENNVLFPRAIEKETAVMENHRKAAS